MAEKAYLVGTVRPTNRPEAGRELDLDTLIPEKIKFISLTMNFSRGTEEEFIDSMPGYEAKVAELAKMGANLIRPSGAPPFMLQGYHREREIIRGWEEKYGVPMFTSGQNHVRALRALGIKKFIGASYFPEKMNNVFARYFTEAGFEVLAMEGIDAPFADVPKVPPEEIFAFIKGVAAKHKEAEGIYMLGSAWKTVGLVERLERETGLPLVHAGPARAWETQLRLGLCHKILGYGRLLAEMPEQDSRGQSG
jgi:maleate cis-trans isomerase